jgi:type III pantothenate kinase
MTVLCFDIGNTRTHHGVLRDGATLAAGEFATAEIDSPVGGAPAVLRQAAAFGATGVAFCSVVPAATERLNEILAAFPAPRVFHLRHDTCPGLGIAYPRPAEIGQDRLANCIGAQVVAGSPAVVIDMGTAVTFDILTSSGYEGGVIAPGLGLFARYLHEQTALLPALDPGDLLVSTGIGKTTLDAMRLGCAVGFAGMIEALLNTVLGELRKRGVARPALLATGGTAGALPRSWAGRIRWLPDLTLRGLEAAFHRARAAAANC